MVEGIKVKGSKNLDMAIVDLHTHSKYSNNPSNWFLKKVGAAESYTEPEAIYQIAKERGMSLVTITDHDELKGSLELAEKYNDAFTGAEISVYFPEDSCKIHLLVYGLSGAQFEEILRIRNDIYQLRVYLDEQKLAHSVAHAAYPLNGKLTLEHLEKLVLLFDVFEIINGSKIPISNKLWENYLKQLDQGKIETLAAKHNIKPSSSQPWRKGLTGGSNDHAGLHLGLTYTEAEASTAAEFLAQLRDRQTTSGGRYSYFADSIFTIAKVAFDLSKNKQRKIGGFPIPNLIDMVFREKKPSFKDRLGVALLKLGKSDPLKLRVSDLMDQIRSQDKPSIEKNLELLYETLTSVSDDLLVKQINSVLKGIERGDLKKILNDVSAALPTFVLTMPFFFSTLAQNTSRPLLEKLKAQTSLKGKRKILWFSDTMNDMNGVSVTLKKLGWKFHNDCIDVRLVSALLDSELSDELPPNFMNLKACYSFQLPYYKQYIVKIPSLLKALKQFNEYEPDEIFISTPGPMGMLGAITARLFNIPITGIYHTDYYLELKELVGDDTIVETMESFTRWFYSQMNEIMVPTKSYFDILEKRGYNRSKMSIFPRHIDRELFSYCPPEKLDGTKLHLPSGLNLLYVGRISQDKNLDFLIKVYREARKQVDEINLIVTGNGPFLPIMQAELDHDKRVVFTGRLPNEKLPLIYSQAHTLVFPSITDTFGMAILEAQCCNLPALVSDKGGPQDIIEDGKTGQVLPSLHLQSWVDAIISLNDMIKNHPDRYEKMRLRTRQRGLEFSSWDKVLNQLVRRETKQN